MTDERQMDEFVSASYRDVAKETTPSHLNEKVLRMAANAAQRSQYSRFTSWTRPLAWAATIALCLAITLEVTRGPVPDAGIGESMSEQSKSEQSMPKESIDEETDAFADDTPAAASPNKAMVDDIRRKRAAEEPRREVRSHQVAPLSFEVKDANVLQHVEELERLQSGSSNEALLDEVVVGCSQETRTSADIWLECITALKEAGDVAAAEIEEELLIEVFPDFKMP